MSVSSLIPHAIGLPLDRLDGPAKVRGMARYAFEQPVDHPAYLFPIQATIAAGRITAVSTKDAAAVPGVLAVLTHENAPKLAANADRELSILQSDEVPFRGRIIGGVIAESSEIARHAAGLVQFAYDEQAHDVVLRYGRADLYAPERVNAGYATDTIQGDVDAELPHAAVTLDEIYSTPWEIHNPMETHSTTGIWADNTLTLYLGSQGVYRIRDLIAPVLGLDPQRLHLISPYIGGGFGSKNFAHADVIFAAMAAQLVPGRPVKLALTRQQMFTQVGYRTPTIQRIRLGSDNKGRLTAIAHDVVEQTAKIKEFAEQTAIPSRTMYAARNRRTTHRLAALDVPPATIMRGPGETPGMFALESAIDEMAFAFGLDPIEFRIRNEPDVDPANGLPFSSRHLVDCLRDGAQRFGWLPRDPTPRTRREDGWLVGTGVAASTYPARRLPGNAATIRASPDGRYTVLIAAADIGTGAWTALTQIAADALQIGVGEIDLRIGDSDFPKASPAGGSTGTSSWGSAIVETARQLRTQLELDHGGTIPAEGYEVTAEMPDNPYASRFAMHSFGAQFAEVRVREDSGEVRVPHLLGVFAAGRIINPKIGRSQLLGGMSMGLSMALFEEGVLDVRLGQVANHDFAEYHIATNADVGSVDVYWLDEEDPYVNPMGAKGIGELGIVGAAAAIANAVFHATGVRVRHLPITLDKLLP